MKRLITILLSFSLILSSGLLYAKPADEIIEEANNHCLCAIRHDLYQYSCQLFNLSDPRVFKDLDTLSLSSFNNSVEKKLKNKEAKIDTVYRNKLLVLQRLVNYSQPIEGKNYNDDYNSLINTIISVFSYAKAEAKADIQILEREEKEYLRKAADAIVEIQLRLAVDSDIQNKKEDVKKAVKSLWVVSLIVLLAFCLGYYLGNSRKNREQISTPSVEPPIEHKGTGAADGTKVAQEKKSMTTEDDTQAKKDTVIQNGEERDFIFENDKICVVGASVIGKNHIAMNLPCQDACAYEALGSGWGIAVSSDGAGSAEHSDIGSKIVVQRAIENYKALFSSKDWVKRNYCPTEAEWTQISYLAIKAVRDDLNNFAQTKSLDIKSLNATLIVIVHTPFGIMSSHVGDGRAGYRNKSGEWKALITPHKGDEANQTIFVPSEFWDVPNYVMSGVFVPESRVIKDDLTAFTLMSDGCESSSWLYNQYDEKMGRYYDPNQPYSKFFEPIVENLRQMQISNVKLEYRLNNWRQFLETGGKFSSEPDDKTMIIGILQ